MQDQGIAEQVAVFGSNSATDTGAGIIVSGVSDGAAAAVSGDVDHAASWG
jgi:hypothetical protein